MEKLNNIQIEQFLTVNNEIDYTADFINSQQYEGLDDPDKTLSGLTISTTFALNK